MPKKNFVARPSYFPTFSEPGALNGRSWSGSLKRSAITDACAIVNDSIAPNA